MYWNVKRDTTLQVGWQQYLRHHQRCCVYAAVFLPMLHTGWESKNKSFAAVTFQFEEPIYGSQNTDFTTFVTPGAVLRSVWRGLVGWICATAFSLTRRTCLSERIICFWEEKFKNLFVLLFYCWLEKYAMIMRLCSRVFLGSNRKHLPARRFSVTTRQNVA